MIQNNLSTFPPIRILYVAGLGHSGSTVLDIIMSNHPDIFGGGELIRLVSNGWIKDEYCACGKPGNQCGFWSEVRRDVESKFSGANLEEYVELQRIYENRFSISKLVREKQLPSSRFQAYTRETLAVFQAIQRVSGCTLIVDSSKEPSRAYALSLIPGIDLYLIHLVRDVRGVSWSLKKTYPKDIRMGVEKEKKPKPVWWTSLSWMLANWQAEWVRKQIVPEKSLFLRYEDMVPNTKATLYQIGDLIGLDLGSIQRKIDNEVPLSVGHTIAGNRLRMNGNLRLRLDDSWKCNLNGFDLAIIRLLSSRLIARYGYSD